MTGLTNKISNIFNRVADHAEGLYDKAVVTALDIAEDNIPALVGTASCFAKAAAISMPAGALIGGALYAAGGFHVDSAMQALQGGAVVFGSFGTMLGTGALAVLGSDDIDVRVTEKINTFKNEYAIRNNVQQSLSV
jgi:hypothetical protein